MRLLKSFSLGLIVFFMLTTSCMATEFIVVTSPRPPFSFNSGLHTEGISVDTMDVIMKMTNTPFDRKNVKLLPWKKAYSRAVALPNQVLLSVPRTPDLENQFKWVGPIYFPKFVLVGKKDKAFTVASAADISKYKIGTIRDSEPCNVMLEMGVNPAALKMSSTYIQPMLQLKSGQVDLFAGSDIATSYYLQCMRLNRDDYKVVFTYKTIPLYFAFNKNTDEAYIKKLNDALAAYKTPMSDWNSVFDKSIRKYLANGVIK